MFTPNNRKANIIWTDNLFAQTVRQVDKMSEKQKKFNSKNTKAKSDAKIDLRPKPCDDKSNLTLENVVVFSEDK